MRLRLDRIAEPARARRWPTVVSWATEFTMRNEALAAGYSTHLERTPAVHVGHMELSLNRVQ